MSSSNLGSSDTTTDAQRQVSLLRYQYQDLRAVVVRGLIGITWMLLAAILLVPLGRSDPNADGERVDHEGLVSLLGFFLDTTADELGDTATHPYSLTVGRVLVIVGLVMVGVGVVVAALAAGRLLDVAQRRVRVALGAGAGALLVGAAVTYLGLMQLPSADHVSVPTWGLLVPMVAGAWLVFSMVSARQTE